MVSLSEIEQFLDHFFAIHQYPKDPGGIYRSSTRSVQRLGLLLEPFPEVAAWVKRHQLDALFLHRPWKLDLEQLPPDVGVIFYHLAFDERLTIGCNPRLAEALSLSSLESFGEKEGRTIGMIGNLPTQPCDRYIHQICEVFGGVEAVVAPKQEQISRVAIVGAMTEALIREAAERTVELYVTGQFRKPSELAVLETGIGIVEVGHQRCEQWGLRAMARVLRERWQSLEIIQK